MLNSLVVLCATVVSSLGQLLSMSATPPIIWMDLGLENVRAMETGVALFHSVLLVSDVHVLLCVTKQVITCGMINVHA